MKYSTRCHGLTLDLYQSVDIYFFSLHLDNRTEGCVVYDHSSTKVIGVVTKHMLCLRANINYNLFVVQKCSAVR